MKKTFLTGLAFIAIAAGAAYYHPETEDHIRMLSRTASAHKRVYDARHQTTIDYYALNDMNGNFLRIEEVDKKGESVAFKKHFPSDRDFKNYAAYFRPSS